MQKKIQEHIFFYEKILIGCFELSLLRREYLPLVENVLTNTLKICHITKRNFFNLKCVCSDQ